MPNATPTVDGDPARQGEFPHPPAQRCEPRPVSRISAFTICVILAPPTPAHMTAVAARMTSKIFGEGDSA
jgi:hypothetical protein